MRLRIAQALIVLTLVANGAFAIANPWNQYTVPVKKRREKTVHCPGLRQYAFHKYKHTEDLMVRPNG